MYLEISETWFLDQVFLNRPNNHLDNLSQGQFGKNRLEKIGKHWYERRLFSHLIPFESADLYHNIKIDIPWPFPKRIWPLYKFKVISYILKLFNTWSMGTSGSVLKVIWHMVFALTTIVIKTSPWRWTQASLHATYNINACLILRSQSKENE